MTLRMSLRLMRPSLFESAFITRFCTLGSAVI